MGLIECNNYQKDIASVMKLLYLRGLVQIRGGNASIYDVDKSLIYISPSGFPRYQIECEDVAIIDINGNIIKGKPSSEWRMHLEIYKNINDARAIVHAHNPFTITLGELDIKPKTELTTESKIRIKCATYVPKITPGTPELAKAVATALKESKCPTAILKGHGVVAYSSESIYEALEIVEALEDLSKIQILLRLLRGS